MPANSSYAICDHRLTKIIATIGPSSDSPEMLRQLIDSGVNVFRLNFSHGTRDGHLETTRNIRDVCSTMNRHIAIMQDLGGPKLRIGNLLEDHVHLHPGEPFRLEKDLENGDERQVGFEDEGWLASVHPGERIVLGDGIINLEIDTCDDTGFNCIIKTGGTLRSRAGLSFPDSAINIGAMRPKDWEDLEFGLEHGVDIIALSFVRGPEDLLAVRKVIRKAENIPLLVAKIERREAVESIDEILDESDGIMVARGDLGISIPIEQVPIVQKTLLRKSREAGKFSITATQMLESMIESPLPTRAEATDVANAVFDGTDAVMLSGETAVGSDPPHAVRIMGNIVIEAENNVVYPVLQEVDGGIESGIVQSMRLLVDSIEARVIFAPYTQGSTAARISRARCGVPIIVGAPDTATARKLGIRHAVFVQVDNSAESLVKKLRKQVKFACSANFIEEGAKAVVAGGLPLDKPGITNFIRALTIGDPL